MFSSLFGIAVWMGIAFAVINGVMGSMNASLLSLGKTITTTLTFTTVFMVLFAFEVTLMGPPAGSGGVVRFFEFFGVMFGLSLISVPLVVWRESKRASREFERIQQASAFAMANFDNLAEDSDKSKIITYRSLSILLLDPTTADGDREMITYLRDNLGEFGRKSCKRSELFANHADMQVWPLKYTDRRRSWLRSSK